MDTKTRHRLEARANVLKALAHPTRLFIVQELSRQEKCVCELTEMIGSDVSTVSKHLSILKEAGIVRNEKRGVQIFYSIKDRTVLRLYRCVESVVRSAAEEKMALLH